MLRRSQQIHDLLLQELHHGKEGRGAAPRGEEQQQRQQQPASKQAELAPTGVLGTLPPLGAFPGAIPG